MSPPPPLPHPWPHPRFRLAVDGGVLDATTLATQAQAYAQALPGAAMAVEAVDARALVLALLTLTGRAKTGLASGPLLVCRHPVPVPAPPMPAWDWLERQGLAALIRADGRIETAAATAPLAVTPFPVTPLPVTPFPMTGVTLALETSGTTGTPKRRHHDLATLVAALHRGHDPDAVWLLTYDPGGFAGLQVLLTAMTAGHLLVAPNGGADVATLAGLAVRHGVTHLSGTPSFWRGLLMSGAPPPLRAVTLGGETADQDLLDRLAARFPTARIRHVYASTELGSVFAVGDGRAGFPAAWLDSAENGGGVSQGGPGADVRLRVADGRLWVRKADTAAEIRTPASQPAAPPLAEGWPMAENWYDTGDRVERVGDRVLFRGRVDGTLNIGGAKVAPEEVEALILAQPGVADAAVIPHPSPMTGWILTAELVIMPATDTPERQAPSLDEAAVLAGVRAALATLPPAARPRRLAVVPALSLAASGKKARPAMTRSPPPA